jgi:histidine ammonia-lyase
MGEQLMTITLTGSDLTVTQVVAAARHGEAVALTPRGHRRHAPGAYRGEHVLSAGEPVYGLTTGVGERKAFLLYRRPAPT